MLAYCHFQYLDQGKWMKVDPFIEDSFLSTRTIKTVLRKERTKCFHTWVKAIDHWY